jgi:hypothetical protein
MRCSVVDDVVDDELALAFALVLAEELGVERPQSLLLLSQGIRGSPYAH